MAEYLTIFRDIITSPPAMFVGVIASWFASFYLVALWAQRCVVAHAGTFHCNKCKASFDRETLRYGLVAIAMAVVGGVILRAIP